MKFSDEFNIETTAKDTWFDTILFVDTPLFIDPFLIYTQENGHFRGSHKEIIGFFNCVFKLIAQSRGDSSSLSYKKAEGDLRFPEVEEFCLGYSSSGTRGSGSGKGLAKNVASAIWEVIQSGLTEITHFEELTIIREGFGADRIGDMTAALLRKRFIDYTAEVCERHKIRTQPVNYRQGWYDVSMQVWSPLRCVLPVNPWNGRRILLTPRKYLRELPSINVDDFWDYCWSNENDLIRNELSHDITKNVSKSDILFIARKYPDVRRQYLEAKEHEHARAYDFDNDPRGLLHWHDASKEFCEKNPLSLSISNESGFLQAVDRMIAEFKHFVEQNQGWVLLWNQNGTPKNEKAAQILCLGIIKHYCRANDIDVTREADIGRGPVDFKVSSGFSLRALIEVKLAKNTRFWHGLQRQFPTYQHAERIKTGYFVVIVQSDSDAQKIGEIQSVVTKQGTGTGYKIRTVVVDARKESWPSASHI